MSFARVGSSLLCWGQGVFVHHRIAIAGEITKRGTRFCWSLTLDNRCCSLIRHIPLLVDASVAHCPCLDFAPAKDERSGRLWMFRIGMAIWRSKLVAPVRLPLPKPLHRARQRPFHLAVFLDQQVLR